MASATEDTGIDELDDAIERHAAWIAEHRDAQATRRERTRYHMQNLLLRRASEVLDGTAAESFDDALPRLFDHLVAGLKGSPGDRAAARPDSG